MRAIVARMPFARVGKDMDGVLLGHQEQPRYRLIHLLMLVRGPSDPMHRKKYGFDVDRLSHNFCVMLQGVADHRSARGLRTTDETRTYTVCFFAVGRIAPDVQLIEAASDEEALEAARSSRLFTRREVWDRHRLVAVIRESALS